MKKFTKILICLLLCVFGFSFAACDDRTEKEKDFTYPSASDAVVGNGGLAVQKGNYVYFVNGYNALENLESKDASHTVGALMLTKLDENGQVVKNEEDLMHDDYYISMSNKLCGYEATNLYIHGEYLYFATPSIEDEKGDRVWAKERVVINRIKLDKSGKLEQVYESGVKVENFSYEYFESGNNLYILALEKGESYYSSNGTDALIRIDATAKSSKEVADNVQSLAYQQSTNTIYFVSSEEDEYVLNQFDIVNNNISLKDTRTQTFSVVAATEDKVFISQTHNASASSKTIDIYVSNNGAGFEMVCSYADGETPYVTADGSAVVIVNSGVFRVVSVDNGVKESIQDGASTIEVVGFVNGCVVYYATTDSETKLKMFSYSNLIQGNSAEVVTLTEVSTTVFKFDVESDDNYIYFLNQEGSNMYLNRVKIQNNFEEEKEMFGVYLESDVPETEEETTEE